MPLITVKQPDGTLAKIPLEDFLKQQRLAASDASVSVSAPVEPPVSAAVASVPDPGPEASQPQAEKESVSSPAVTPPFLSSSLAEELNPSIDPLPVVQAMPADGARLHLEKPPILPHPETVEDARQFIAEISAPTPAPVVMAEEVSDTDKVLKALSFSVPPDYENRLRSIIQLRLKDVQNPEQTADSLRRSFAEGGMELRPLQVDEVLEACARLHEQVLVPGTTTLAVSPAVTSFKTAPRRMPIKTDSAFPIRNKPRSVSSSFDDFEPSKERPKTRPILADVVFKPLAIGPVEEIRAMTLIDFRRMSPVVDDAALRLEQKFTNLKAESIVLFLQALNAWRESALYQEYTARTLTAILYRKPLANVLEEQKGGITLPEVASLLAMEKRLSF